VEEKEKGKKSKGINLKKEEKGKDIKRNKI